MQFLDLEYINEVVEGTRNHLIRKTKSYPYTYHDRLTNFPNPDGTRIDQIERLINDLRIDKENTNRHQAITSIPLIDLESNDPPCLQRVWCKLIDGRLVMHTTWRSRDGFGAWHMNALAMTELQKRIANEIGSPVGCYVEFNDSVHLYENKWEQVRRFISVVNKRRKDTELPKRL